MNEHFDRLKQVPPGEFERKSVVDEFTTALELMSVDHPDLVGRSSDFQSQLLEWLRQPSASDNDVPF